MVFVFNGYCSVALYYIALHGNTLVFKLLDGLFGLPELRDIHFYVMLEKLPVTIYVLNEVVQVKCAAAAVWQKFKVGLDCLAGPL